MAQYATFNPSVPAPSPVTGWYDTNVYNYPKLPNSRIALTAEQWEHRMTGLWAVADDTLVQYTRPIPPAQQTAAHEFGDADIPAIIAYAQSLERRIATLEAVMRQYANGTVN
jgi:hypothetical protein